MTQDISDEIILYQPCYDGDMRPHVSGCWVRQHDYAAVYARLKEVEAERDGLDYMVGEGRARLEAAEAKLAIAREALAGFIYETTHLSPEETDGSHWCKIGKDCLAKGREALALIGQPAERCIVCGDSILSTDEDGGPECEARVRKWVCSRECYVTLLDRAEMTYEQARAIYTPGERQAKAEKPAEKEQTDG